MYLDVVVSNVVKNATRLNGNRIGESVCPRRKYFTSEVTQLRRFEARECIEVPRYVTWRKFDSKNYIKNAFPCTTFCCRTGIYRYTDSNYNGHSKFNK